MPILQRWGFVLSRLKEKGHSCYTLRLLLLSWNFCVYHLGILYKIITVVYLQWFRRAIGSYQGKQWFGTEHSMRPGSGKIIALRKWNLACAWEKFRFLIGKPIAAHPKYCIFRLFCHIQVMQRRHAFQTEDVFVGILKVIGLLVDTFTRLVSVFSLISCDNY